MDTIKRWLLDRGNMSLEFIRGIIRPIIAVSLIGAYLFCIYTNKPVNGLEKIVWFIIGFYFGKREIEKLNQGGK